MRNWQPLTAADSVPQLPSGATVIDSHCHLDFVDFDADRAALMARAQAAGVAAMITIGASGSLQANWDAVDLAARHANVAATVGVHPHEASTVDDGVLDRLGDLARSPSVVAIGETGLDYHYDHSPRSLQQEAFRRFIALARTLSLPLVVHLRAADEDAVAILRAERAADVGGVIHCFSSDTRCARAFLDLGFHLSFSGIVTFKTATDVREAARLTPADRLLVETDAPFLAPVPFRGRRNEPALVVQTALALAEIRGEPLQTVAANTVANTRRLFRLS